MRSVQDNLSYLQTYEFAEKVNVANGLDLARSIIRSDQAVKELVEQTRKDSVVAGRVLNSIRELARSPFDASYESPFDCALAALLLVIEEARPDVRRVAALLVGKALGTWWARRLASEALVDSEDATHSDLEASSPMPASSQGNYDADVISLYSSWSFPIFVPASSRYVGRLDDASPPIRDVVWPTMQGFERVGVGRVQTGGSRDTEVRR